MCIRDRQQEEALDGLVQLNSDNTELPELLESVREARQLTEQSLMALKQSAMLESLEALAAPPDATPRPLRPGTTTNAEVHEQLMAFNESAKVILTVRDSAEVWAKSFISTIGNRIRVPGERNFARPPFALFRPFVDLLDMCVRMYELLGIDFDESGDANEASAIAAYDAWIAKVRATVPADRLLVFNVKQGWAPLCEFLGVADCPEEFPHSNAGANLIHEFKMAGYIADAFFPTVALLALSVAYCLKR